MTQYPRPAHQAVTQGLADILVRLKRLENRTNAVGTNSDGSITIANLRVVNSTTGQVLAYNGAPSTGNLIISMSASAGVDPWGNAYPAGFMLGSTAITNGTSLVLDPADMYPYPTLHFSPQDAGQTLGAHSAAYANAIPWPNGPSGVVASGIGINTGQFVTSAGVTTSQRLFLNQGGPVPTAALEGIDTSAVHTGGRVWISPSYASMEMATNGADGNTAASWQIYGSGHIYGTGALARDQNQGPTTLFFYDMWGTGSILGAGGVTAFALSFGATWSGSIHYGATVFDGGSGAFMVSFLGTISSTGYTVSVKNIGGSTGTGINVYSQAWRVS